jgi:hypothetical protein
LRAIHALRHFFRASHILAEKLLPYPAGAWIYIKRFSKASSNSFINRIRGVAGIFFVYSMMRLLPKLLTNITYVRSKMQNIFFDIPHGRFFIARINHILYYVDICGKITSGEIK